MSFTQKSKTVDAVPGRTVRRALFGGFAIVALLATAAPLSQARADDDDMRGDHAPMFMAQQGGPGAMMGDEGRPGPGKGAKDRKRADRKGRGHDEAGPGRGGPRGRHGGWMSQRLLDTNHDGKVTLDEIIAEEKRLFAAADVDGDGKLSTEEFRRRGNWFMQLRAMSLFDMLDANGDGTLSADEITRPSESWFKRYDTDKSGALEPGETGRSARRAGRGVGGR